MASVNVEGQNDSVGTKSGGLQQGGRGASREPGGKEIRLDPRTACEFKPSGSAIHHLADGPPDNCAVNYLSSESVSVTDLDWWISDKRLRDTAADAGVSLDLDDIVFAEHKVNGKSKGSVIMNCRSPESASMLMRWFHNNTFEGKKIQPTYVTNGSNIKSMGDDNKRSPVNIPGATTFATNAHGGINFNRLRPINKQPMSQLVRHGNIGMGRPANKGLFHKIESGQLGIQDGMQYGDWPREAVGGWATLESYYPSFASVGVDQLSVSNQALPIGGFYSAEGVNLR